MKFEFMIKKHDDSTFAPMIKMILRQHNLHFRVFVIITNNVFNNNILFEFLIKNLLIIFEHTNFTSKFENKNELKMIHVFCLTHVLQLLLQAFLSNVRVNSINNEL